MSNDLYVIHENDYMQHITDKVELYNMMRTITEAVRELPECEKLVSLKCAAANMEKCAQMMFDAWGIPEEYLEDGNRVHLTELFEEELLPVENISTMRNPAGMIIIRHPHDGGNADRSNRPAEHRHAADSCGAVTR